MIHTQDVTITDVFCGCGGSSDGARRTNRGNRQVRIKYAINHWKRAIETHNSNFPETDHVLTDINETRPENFEATTLLIASPECVNHALAKGKRRKNLGQLTLPLDGEEGGSLVVEAEERSRCTMWDPQRWARVHKYEYILLENVVDVVFWDQYETWKKGWANLDKGLSYEFQEVYLNSQFFWPCPQSRDRWYFVAWKKGNPRPNLNFTPPAFCGHCQQQVFAIQVWKKPHKVWGRYKRQYLYHCPMCNSSVIPFYFAAASAIDWSFPIQRIGDRKKPLEPKTIHRIEVGLEKFQRREPFTVQVNKTTDRVRGVLDEPLPTQTADNGLALVDPFLVNLSHQGNDPSRVSSMEQPIPTQTARADLGMTVPPFLLNLNHDRVRPVSVTEEAFPTQTSYDSRGLVVGMQSRPLQVDLTGEYRLRDIVAPCSTIVGEGNHHGVLVPPGAEPFIAELHGTSLAHSVTDPLAAVCAGGLHHGLVIPQDGQGKNAWLMTYYNNGQLVSTNQAVPTVTTKHRCALLTSDQAATSTITLEDCGFRMLQPEEIKAAMSFLSQYIITGNRKEQVKQLGNAVTPPVMQWLVERVLDVLA